MKQNRDLNTCACWQVWSTVIHPEKNFVRMWCGNFVLGVGEVVFCFDATQMINMKFRRLKLMMLLIDEKVCA
jgi:hypothetical protein